MKIRTIEVQASKKKWGGSASNGGSTDTSIGVVVDFDQEMTEKDVKIHVLSLRRELEKVLQLDMLAQGYETNPQEVGIISEYSKAIEKVQ